jgi:hypothetical protein
MKKMDGFDDCIAGIVERFGQDDILCYDIGLVCEKLTCDGMSYEEANEWYQFNMVGAWVGDDTPCFIRMGEVPEDL